MPRRTKQQTGQGARLAEFRKTAGPSQSELARPQNAAHWALYSSKLSPSDDVLTALARLLGVSVEGLVLSDAALEAGRRPGPRGRRLKNFEAASSLPRSQQLPVEQLVSTLLAQRKAG